MTSFNEERFDLKTQFQPTQRNEKSVSDLIRKKPASKPKKDFEKVMKQKDDEGEEKQVMGDNKDGLQKQMGGVLAGVGAFEGIAAREGYLPEKSTGADAGSEKKERTEFMQEQTDLSGIQQMSQDQKFVALANEVSEVDRSKAQDALKKVQEIVDQIVQKIYTLEQEGKTETILTLKHPPLFAGVDLKLTEWDTARKEFNITFSNVRSDAKPILDALVTQNVLQRALEQRGYVTHIIVVTTQKEEPIATREPSQKEEKDLYEERKQQQQQQQQG